MDYTYTFLSIFFKGFFLIAPLLIFFSVIIILLGLVVGKIEKWSPFDALYWSFITALTVGYGDIKPERKVSKILSVAIGTFGIILGGILVALSVEAASHAYREHIKPDSYRIEMHDKQM